MILIFTKLCVIMWQYTLKTTTSNVSYIYLMKNQRPVISISKCYFDNLIIDIASGNYINSLGIMCSFAAENVENLKQLVKTRVSSASYLYFEQN